MALRREITAQITDLLRKNPQGLSITEIVRSGGINRNTAGRYLDNLLVSGQVEMRHFGMAKIYTLSQRLPASSVLALSSELVMQLDSSLRIVFLNQPFIDMLGTSEKECLGKNIEFSPVHPFFDEMFPRLLTSIREGLEGTESTGEVEVPGQDLIFFCRITPTVFNNGQKGVSVLFEDITRRRRDEARIRESEARLRSIIRVAPIGIGVVSDRILLEVNDQVCRMTGFEAGDLIGYPARKLYSTEEEYDCVGKVKYEQIRMTGTGSVETQWQKKDGSIIDILLSSTPLNPADPGAGITFTALDITERKRVETALRENEEKFRALFNNAEDMIMLHELSLEKVHSRYIEVNDVACRKLNYSRPELLRMTPRDLVAGDFLSFVSSDAHSKLHEEGHVTFEAVLLAKDQRRLPVEINAHIFEFRGKAVVLAIIRDITERKQTEDQLRLMKISIDKAYDEVFWMDMDANFLYVNDAACRVTGYSPRELYAMKVYTLDPDFTPARWTESIADLRKNKRQFFQTRHRRKDGVILDVEIGSVYVTREEEEYSFCFVRDITERKQIEAALRESEARYRSLAEVSQDMIFVIDREDRVIYVNQQAADFLGKCPDEIIGKPRGDNFPEEIAARQYHALQHIFTSGQPIRSEGPMTVRGQVRWFDHALVPIPGEDGSVASVLGVSRDITKRIESEKVQWQNVEANRFIAEHSVDIINRQTPDCILTYTSPSVTAQLGYTPEEVLGKPVLAMVHPDDLPGVQKDIAEILGGSQDMVTSMFRFRHKDGRYLCFESTTRIIRDESGRVKEFLSISRDITHRKNDKTKKDQTG